MKTLISALLSASLLLLLPNTEVIMASEANAVTLEWYGHSCFLLTLHNGAKILIDPYDTTRLPYSLPEGKVDVIFSTHDHFDHNAVQAVPSKVILRADGKQPVFFGSKSRFTIRSDGDTEVDLQGIPLVCRTVPSWHDEKGGSKRGANGIIRFTVEGITFVHVGDLGDTLNAEQLANLKPVDVLLIPVGGFYTIDAPTAKSVVQALSPHVVIPMHYKTDILSEGFPIAGVDPFLEGYDNVNREASSAIELQAGKMPDSMTIEALKYHGQR